ncbi:hypothetical protein NDU88_006586 [Pleurodeles waltl]|uniref:Uncharacterized protein n=1 Tax=Pleurodeles waltl TaxID=8319 RepID=A0AAV7ULG1_PLEWA|nr:hypothetical protein NDU88_006586 [Pleurodeles waltl]
MPDRTDRVTARAFFPGARQPTHFGVSAWLAGDLAEGRGGRVSKSWCFPFAPETRWMAEEQKVGNSGAEQEKEASRFVT